MVTITYICFEQLDAGVDEKIMLTSRDDETSVIVSYKEVKNCIVSAFKEVNNNKPQR